MKEIFSIITSILCTISALSCSGAKTANVETTISHSDSIVYYIYHDADSDTNCEDVVLEFSYKSGMVVDGYCWGTSDEFVDAREGYYPGFFVQRISQISHSGNSLTFVLDIRNTLYFSGPVDIRIHSADEAVKQGYHEWMQEQKNFQDSITYKGEFRDCTFILFKDKSNFPCLNNRIFTRTPLSSLIQMMRQCLFEEENRKSY